MAGSVDLFANLAYVECTETAANTLTFAKLETGITMFQKMAWIIHRLEYTLHTWIDSLFQASGDTISIALTTTNLLVQIEPKAVNNMAQSQILDALCFETTVSGAGTRNFFYEWPVVHDFNALPGGGLIVPPNPLYLGIMGSQAPAAARVGLRIYFTVKELKPDEYIELAQARTIIT